MTDFENLSLNKSLSCLEFLGHSQNDFLRMVFQSYFEKIKTAAPTADCRVKAQHIMAAYMNSLKDIPTISPAVINKVKVEFRGNPTFLKEELHIAAESNDRLIQSWGERILQHVAGTILNLDDAEEIQDILQEFFIITFACLWRAHLEQ